MANPSSRADEIINVAIDLAEDRGVAGVTTAALARRLRFTEAALYRYFPGKAAILAAALEHLGERVFVSMVLELLPHVAHDDVTLQGQLDRHIQRFGLRQGLLLELLLCAAGSREAPMQESANVFLQEYVERMVTYFTQLQELRWLDDQLPATELARMWVCQLLGGFVRCRIARETWSPIEQPGYAAFGAMIRKQHRAAAGLAQSAR